MENSWRSPKALWGSWRQFRFMEPKSIIVCESLEQSKMFWEAYQHFYDTNKQPTFRQEEEGETSDMFSYMEGDIHTYEKMRDNLKPLNTTPKGMVHSIIGEHHQKGIPNIQKSIIEKHLTSYDLGDSRNFKSAEQLIYKLTKLRNSKLYFGSVCSWSRIARVFGLEVYKV